MKLRRQHRSCRQSNPGISGAALGAKADPRVIICRQQQR
jgi:hypothetical protein